MKVEVPVALHTRTHIPQTTGHTERAMVEIVTHPEEVTMAAEAAGTKSV